MEMETIIKDYLDKIAENDPAFKIVYDPEKADECVKAIYDKIQETFRKKKGSGGCAVKDEDVYKMARDFFLDGKFEVDEKSVIVFKRPKTKKEDQDNDEDEPEETEEQRKERLAEMERQRKEAELARIKREQEERERKQYEKEHANGQTTIFDLGA